MNRVLIHLFLVLALVPMTPPAQAREIFQDIVIQPGDTLWGIANKYLKDPKRWPDIVKHNNLQSSDPTVPLSGSKVKVPILLIKEEYRNAQLVKMIPEVRYKRKGESKWKEARKNLTLRYEDSLRTMKGGSAHVRFPSKEIVQINENTYVVLKPERILQEIELLRGEVRASQAKVIMPTGTVVKPKGRRSDYQAKIREDDTEVVFVYKGKVDVTAQGKTVTIREGFGTEVPKFSAPKEPKPLSSFKDFDPLEMTARAAQASVGYSNKRPSDLAKIPNGAFDPVKSAKSKAISSKGLLISYSLQLAKDELFKTIVFETTQEIGSMFDVKKANIPDGTYYMHVAFTDALGVTGKYSEPSIIQKDTKAPVISNLFPKNNQRFEGKEPFCDVIGQVKGATLISINDEVVFIGPTGRFSKYVHLKEGINDINVIARDANGNETKVRRTVTYTKN